MTEEQKRLRATLFTADQAEQFASDVYALTGLWALIAEMIRRAERVAPDLTPDQTMGQLALLMDADLADAFRGALQNTLWLCARLGYDPNDMPAAPTAAERPTRLLPVTLPPPTRRH